MAVTQEFMDAMKSGKVIRVRIMLKNSLLIDPTAVQFDEMERYATPQMNDIYTEHDGEDLNFDVTAWNEDYLNRQMVIVVNNFSKERIHLLKSMVLYLYKDKADKIRKGPTSNPKSHKISRKQVGIGVIAIGAALAAAGLCTAVAAEELHPFPIALMASGAVIAAVGIVLFLSGKEN